MDVKAERVRRGAAWVYRRYARVAPCFQLEREAKAARRALWRLPEAERVPAWEWRHQPRTGRAPRGRWLLAAAYSAGIVFRTTDAEPDTYSSPSARADRSGQSGRSGSMCGPWSWCRSKADKANATPRTPTTTFLDFMETAYPLKPSPVSADSARYPPAAL